jgi:hypothetical protein
MSNKNEIPSSIDSREGFKNHVHDGWVLRGDHGFDGEFLYIIIIW